MQRIWSRPTVVIVPIAFVLIWSSGYIAGTIGAQSSPPLALAAWRFLAAFVIIATISLFTRAPWPTQPSVYLHLLIAGTLFQTVQLGGVYLGLSFGISAGLTSMIINTAPLIVSALAVPLFSEQLSGRQWFGLGIGLIGVAISLSSKLNGDVQQLVGYGLIGIALLGLVAGMLYQKKFAQSVDLRTGIAVQLLGATITSFPLAALHGGVQLPLIAPTLFSLGWTATINSIGGFALLFILLQKRSSGATTSLLYLVPPTTAVLAVPLLNQGVTISVFIGMAVAGIGVMLTLTARRKSSNEAASLDVKTGPTTSEVVQSELITPWDTGVPSSRHLA